MRKFPMKKKGSSSLLALLAGLMISGCSTTDRSDQLIISGADNLSLKQAVELSDVANKQEIIKGLDQILAGDYRGASGTFNRALMDSPNDGNLHYLNGMTYHLMSDAGLGDKYELAAMGYLNAIDAAPHNWLPYYQIGRIFLKQKKYIPAQEAFANVLLLQPDNFEATYNLAMSSYYAHDPVCALKYINKAVQMAPERSDVLRSATIIAAASDQKDLAHRYFEKYKGTNPSERDLTYITKRMREWDKLHASGTVIKAHQEAQAKKQAEAELKKKADAQAKAHAVAQSRALKEAQARAASLEQALANAQQNQNLIMASANDKFMTNLSSYDQSSAPLPPETVGEGAAGAQPASETASQPATDQAFESMPPVTGGGGVPGVPPVASATYPPKSIEGASGPMPPALPPEPSIDMVLIDGVIMRITESGTTDKGNNIMESLNAALTASKTAVRTQTFTKTSLEPVRQLAETNVITRNLGAALFSGSSGSPVTYSLNIANTFRQYFEVIGRPTLTVTVGSEGTFYSGDDRFLPIKGDRGGSIEKLPIGVELKVTPVKIEGDIVTLKVTMKGASVLIDPTGDVSLSYLVIGSSYVTTEVKAKIGESVVLAGIKIRRQNDTKSGFPGLMEIPGLQYFFSSENTADESRTILYTMIVRGYGKSMDDIKAAFAKEGSEQEALIELEAKENEKGGEWLEPTPTALLMLRDLKPLFREFRYGDVKPLDYKMNDTPSQMIDQFVPFIYY